MNFKKEYKDFYDLFGLPTSADKNEIKSRTKSMIKKFHPDVADEEIAATPEQFTTLNFAKETLLDEEKREKYDEMGHSKYVEEFGENKVKGFSFTDKRSIMDVSSIKSPENADELIKNNLNEVHKSTVSKNKKMKSNKQYELKKETKNNNKSSTGGLLILIGSFITSRFVKSIIFLLLFLILFYYTYVILGLLATIFTIAVSILFLIVVKKLVI